MLQMIDISKSYKNVHALDHVNLRIEKGKVVGLLGASGSGKSTFMKLTAGIIVSHSGEIRIDDMEIGAVTKSVTSILTENNNFPKWMTVNDVIHFYKLFYKDFNEARFDEWMQTIELNGFRMKKITSLSKGTLQKIRLVLTMSRDARLFLLDEPLGGIDPLARDEILELLATQISSEITIIMSTHLISEIEGLLDQAIFINEGKILGIYDCEDIRINEGKSIENLYKEVLRNARACQV